MEISNLVPKCKKKVQYISPADNFFYKLIPKLYNLSLNWSLKNTTCCQIDLAPSILQLNNKMIYQI